MTGQEIIISDQAHDLATTDLERAGRAANHAAARHAFSEYQDRKSENTLVAQRQALESFQAFLAKVGVQTGDLFTDPHAWRGVTWGLVKAFVNSLLQDGYSVATVNLRLSTVKVYATLAASAGAIDARELALIKTVTGYRKREAKNIDKVRDTTRRGHKKAEWTTISPEQADRLKAQPDTPQGRRDAVIMAILIDHGLRVSELVLLTVGDVDLEKNELRFYRPKVDQADRHWLTPDSRRALMAYMKNDAPPLGPLLRESRKDGRLGDAGITERAVNARVRALGRKIGIENLSPHDLRHYGATELARNNTPLDRLQAWGGWNSYAMPLTYIRRAEHGNEGVCYGK